MILVLEPFLIPEISITGFDCNTTVKGRDWLDMVVEVRVQFCKEKFRKQYNLLSRQLPGARANFYQLYPIQVVQSSGKIGAKHNQLNGVTG